MIVLDAQALTAFLRDEPAAAEVASILRSPSLISAVNVAEVVDQLARIDRRPRLRVRRIIGSMQFAGLAVVAATEEHAKLAGLLRAKHYRRKVSPVSMADCFAAATALGVSAPLATADAALADLVRREGGTVIELPSSRS